MAKWAKLGGCEMSSVKARPTERRLGIYQNIQEAKDNKFFREKCAVCSQPFHMGREEESTSPALQI